MKNKMRRLGTLLIVFIMFPALMQAKNPKWLKNAKKAVVEVIAYNDEGKEISRSNGFFINDDGTGLTGLDVLQDANSAVTVDAAGIKRPIVILLGADNTYDVVRFRVEPDKKLKALTLSPQVKAAETDKVYLLPYKKNLKELSVSGVERISDTHSYYTVDAPWDSTMLDSPLLNDAGIVIGMVQKGKTGDPQTYAIDAGYVNDIEITALNRDDNVYRDLKIKVSLPQDEDQALAYIMMKRGVRSMAECRPLHEQFLEQFPDSPDGMFAMGTFLIQETDSTEYDAGLEFIEKAFAAAQDKERFHCDYANIILNHLLQGLKAPAAWTYEKALSEIDAALKIDGKPVYHEIRGNILYAMERYPEAYNSYVKVNASDIASSDTYLRAYYISLHMEDSINLSIALLDSVIIKFGTPMPQRASQVLMERAILKEEAGRNREAVVDYYTYESLLGTYSMSAEFYYRRAQVEIKARMFEQALNDMEKARSLAPDDSSLVLEHASLMLRVGDTDGALPLLEELVISYPDVGDVQRLLGVCYMRRDEMEKARRHLTLAKELGDEPAATLLEQF